MEKLIASDETALDTIKTKSSDATFDASKISVKPLKYGADGMLEHAGTQLPLTIAFRDTMTLTWHPEISDELQKCMNAYSKIFLGEQPVANAAGLRNFSRFGDGDLQVLARELDDQFEFYSIDNQKLKIENLKNLQQEADAVARKTTADIEKLSTPAAIKDLVDTMMRRKDFLGSMAPIRYSSAIARAAKTSAKVGKITSVAGLALGSTAGLLDALWDTVSEPRFENFNVVCQDTLYAMKSDAQILENEINNINPLSYSAVRQQLADLQAYNLD